MEHDFWTALIVSVAATAVTTAAPAGTVVPYSLVSHIDPRLLGFLLALSAGALIYVGATHLLPRAELEPRRFSLATVAAGVAVALEVIPTER